MNNELIEIFIDLATSTPEDAINQNELFYIYEELESKGACLIPLESAILPNYNQKSGSGDIDILIGAIHIALPASAVVAVLVSFVKKYFDTCKSKRLRIKRKDGSIVEISGYNGKETEKILHKLINYK
ncbi:MAG: hypothetical protein WGN25_05690 [Candidatus Electrothrix sp. GW3-4]|uniref:hypothetical protein n=1 Tax=Candidatus Electrothrix sp. GW3-4 TaxID=3126740 RepID=UPI0030CAD597